MASLKTNAAELHRRVSHAPTGPGIYRWKNKGGDILYIGKAKNLRSRLKSYVSADALRALADKLEKPDAALGPWKLSLIRQIADFDVTITNTELEALILETNLIKALKPKYNVMMKDDKNYVYVKITTADPYPAVTIVRRMEEDGSKYFGPYTKAFEIRQTLEMLHTIFPHRACEASLKTLKKNPEADLRGATPCLAYQIGQCCGLCIGAMNKEEYHNAIEKLMRFLKGNRSEAREKLRRQMQDAAAEKRFERAGELRDALSVIEGMEERQIVSDTSREDADVFGIALLGSRAHVVLLKERSGKLIDEEHFPLAGEANSIGEALEQFLPQYYGATEDIPDLVVIGEEIEDRLIIEELLRTKRGKNVELRVAERGKKSQLLKLAEKNAEEKVKQLRAKWEAAANNIESALKGLKELLGLPHEPHRIECYDISHLGGEETVGSMVVARNGKAVNDQYRSFTIQTVSRGEIDDYKALAEVLRRRLRHLDDAEARWKEKGVTFGKARKDEQKSIETISKKNRMAIGDDQIDYRDYIVARHKGAIVSFAGLHEHPGNILHLRSLWVRKEYRGAKLGQTVIRKLLKTAKKRKVYVILDPKSRLEECYTEIGFQLVRTPPKILQEITEKFYKEHPGAERGVIMVRIPSQHKEDASLKTKPDLIVIDGGKGQLNTAVNVLDEFGMVIPVIGLAKREEEVFVPGNPDPVPFPKDSQAKFLLQRLRDEAHRFANKLRTTKKIKAVVASTLDDVPGIGEKTKMALLRHFGTVANVRRASDDELRTIVNQSQLEALRRSL